MVKRPRKICHANFFKAGICLGQQLVAAVKTSALSTTIKVYEPKEQMGSKGKKTGFAKMMLSTGGADQLKPYKEFYIPTESTSIHFLRSKLCVGCARGFEVVSLETLETQSLLDQADTSLDFVVRKENIKPIHIERMASEFLLCYTDYSFFVNRNGWRARPDWKITWEGTPQAFAIFNPYILAFEPSFIEIRHMESGGLVHIITGKNIRWLHTSTREVCYPTMVLFATFFVLILLNRFSTRTKTSSATTLSPALTFGKLLMQANNPWTRLARWKNTNSWSSSAHTHIYTHTMADHNEQASFLMLSPLSAAITFRPSILVKRKTGFERANNQCMGSTESRVFGDRMKRGFSLFFFLFFTTLAFVII
jgi:hypothetical protein